MYGWRPWDVRAQILFDTATNILGGASDRSSFIDMLWLLCNEPCHSTTEA
jgi:hypothetical protein